MSSASQPCSKPLGTTPLRGLTPTTLLGRRESATGEQPLRTRPKQSLIVRSSASPINWGPAPASFPPGARMAVLQGDPTAKELFIAFLRLPDGYELPPHTHSTDEHITVITGTLRVGTGPVADEAKMVSLCSGGSATAAAGEAHYAKAEGVTIVQVNALGPFDIRYVDAPELRLAAGAER
jgi:quercetin dioxygenase-like cupin family protein